MKSEEFLAKFLLAGFVKQTRGRKANGVPTENCCCEERKSPQLEKKITAARKEIPCSTEKHFLLLKIIFPAAGNGYSTINKNRKSHINLEYSDKIIIFAQQIQQKMPLWTLRKNY